MQISGVKLPSNRSFGILFSLVFTALSLYFFHNSVYHISLVAFVGAVSLILITWLRPASLTPLNVLWMRFGLLLGKVINPAVFGLIYFFLVTPIGLLMRIFGTDNLNLKLDKDKSSWKFRPDVEQSSDFRNQF